MAKVIARTRFVEHINSSKDMFGTLEEFMKDAIRTNRYVIITAQHLHPETYNIIRDYSQRKGNPPHMTLMTSVDKLVKKDGKEYLHLIHLEERIKKTDGLDITLDGKIIGDLQLLKDKGIKVELLTPEQVIIKYTSLGYPTAWEEIWATKDSIIYLYPHEPPAHPNKS